MFDFENKSVWIGYYTHSGKKSKQMYVSHRFKICAVMEGSEIWRINGKNYEISKNDIILLNNRDERDFLIKDPKSSFKLLIAEFEPQLLYSTNFLSIFINRTENFNPVLKSGATEHIMQLFKKVEEEQTLKESECDTVILSSIINILVYISRFYNQKGFHLGERRLSERMNHALDYLNKNFDTKICLKDAALIMHMSENAFSKCFLKSNGIGFNQYILRKRIEKALYLLKTTDETVLSIALTCGFNNGASFYQAFKKIVGAPPRSFR